jgi:ElaB/YqjD/DUF883 family membrane-anchored ribosome-binding protein
MVNVREIAEAFIEGKPYFDGKYLVVKRHPHEYCEVRAIAYFRGVTCDQTISNTMLYLDISRDVKREDMYLFINKLPDVSEGVEILNEISDYIYDVIGVRITAFTIDNDNAMYLAVKGYEYPFREYKRVMTIVKRESASEAVWVQGYYRRFALFRDCKECEEYAKRIEELKTELSKLFDELEEWYYKAGYKQLQQVLGERPRRALKELEYRVNTLKNRNVTVANIGMYIDRTPKETYQRYLRLYNTLSALVDTAREIYTLQTLTS